MGVYCQNFYQHSTETYRVWQDKEDMDDTGFLEIKKYLGDGKNIVPLNLGY